MYNKANICYLLQMKYLKKWFTLVEIVVSLSILIMIITIVSLSMWKIYNSIHTSTQSSQLFENVQSVFIEKYKTQEYSSWIVVQYSSWFSALVLYKPNGKWILYGTFDYNSKMYDYRLSRVNITYDKRYFWSFDLSKVQVDQILADPNTLLSRNFNNWRVFDRMLVNKFSISHIMLNNLYVLDIELFREMPGMVEWKKKTDYIIGEENFIELRLNL